MRNNNILIFIREDDWYNTFGQKGKVSFYGQRILISRYKLIYLTNVANTLLFSESINDIDLFDINSEMLEKI